MRYALALLLSGAVWFGVSCLCLHDLTEKPLAHFFCAVVTSFVVGYLYRAKIRESVGWRFYLLWPIVILVTALATYGLLIPTSWLIAGRAEGYGVDSEAFLNVPSIFLMSGLTFFLPLLFQLTLGTNFLLREILKREEKP